MAYNVEECIRKDNEIFQKIKNGFKKNENGIWVYNGNIGGITYRSVMNKKGKLDSEPIKTVNKIIPKNSIIKGDLDLQFSMVKTLPPNLTIEGKLLLPAYFEKIPKNLKVKELDLSDSSIFEIPDCLKVKSLFVECTKLEKLSKSLANIEYLDISGTKITHIPNWLKVKRLIADNTNIKNYPIVYNCGIDDWTIMLDLRNKKKIWIGNRKMTKYAALKLANIFAGKLRHDFKKQIKKCYNMWDFENNKFRKI